MKRANTAKETADSPAGLSFPVTTNDSTECCEFEPKGLYVGTGGTVVMRLIGDTADRTFVNVAAGSVLPVRPRIIKATGTTASDMIVLV